VIVSKICSRHGYHKGSSCPKCQKSKAKEKKWTTDMYMISEIGKRTDIEFRTVSVEEDIKNFRRNV
jgi:hypothetical protein